MEIAEYCKKIDEHLSGITDTDQRLEVTAKILSQAFRVGSDEVAIFVLDPEKDLLHFMWPHKLKTIGFLPLSSLDSLAARTVRENKPFINNRFASVHHASIFERVRLGDKVEKPQPIQKIISVPIPGKERPQGVIQISRKGESADETVDFTKFDLNNMNQIAITLAKRLE
jgi:hypothetical protein